MSITGVMSGNCCPSSACSLGTTAVPERKEFDHVAAPAVVVLVQLDLDDAQHTAADRLRFCLHAFHRELARVVQGLGVLLGLDIL